MLQRRKTSSNAKPLPRGIRNCNPLNIRIGNTWLGERENPDDTEFEQFVSMEYGIRAAFLILRRYIRRYHLNTIRLIISRWAPASENNTERYIQFVARGTRLGADQVIDFSDKDALCSIVYWMIIEECGQAVDMAVIRKSYNMA